MGQQLLGGTGAPSGTGFTTIVHGISTFAALKADGSIVAWESSTSGGSGAPTGTGFTTIVGHHQAFAALARRRRLDRRVGYEHVRR